MLDAQAVPRQINRGQFLRLGVAGVVGGSARGCWPARPRAPCRRPRPRATTSASCRSARVAELTSRAWYRGALPTTGAFAPAERRRLQQVARRQGRPHRAAQRSRSAADAIQRRRLRRDLRRTARSRTKARALALGEDIEWLLVGVYLERRGLRARRGHAPAARPAAGLRRPAARVDARPERRAPRRPACRSRSRSSRPARRSTASSPTPNFPDLPKGPLPVLPRPLMRPRRTARRRCSLATAVVARVLPGRAPRRHRLRRRVAARRVPGDRRLADVQLRRLEPAPAADRARRARRPLRVGQPGRARGAVPRGQVLAAGHVRDERARHGHAEEQPGRPALRLRPAQRAATRLAVGTRRRADRRLHAPAPAPHAAHVDPVDEHASASSRT